MSVATLQDGRVSKIRPLLPASCVLEQSAYLPDAASTVLRGRAAVRGLGDRLLVLCGPCSPHDTDDALEYARKLAETASSLSSDLVILMRCNYSAPPDCEWRGLAWDPDLDGSLNINKGLKVARDLLLGVNQLGLPVACEFADAIVPQYIADLVSWGQVGSAGAQSRAQQQLASGLSMPVGFSAPSDAAEGAAEAIMEAAKAHPFIGVSKQGVAGVVHTTGNHDCHAIVAGDADVGKMADELCKAGLPAGMVVDCAATADGDQAAAVKRVTDAVAKGGTAVSGVVLKSFLVSGAQPLAGKGGPGPGNRVRGMSVTNPCVDWSETRALLDSLAAAVRARRTAAGGGGASAGSASAAKAPASAAPAEDGASLRTVLFRESTSQLPTDNLRIRGVQALVPAACLQEELPVSPQAADLVTATRAAVRSALGARATALGSAGVRSSASLSGDHDDRLVVVAGPCAVHDAGAALQFAARLANAARTHCGELLVLMRCAYSAPDKSTWRGLVMDPDLNGNLNINLGLRTFRELVQAVNQLGLPVACEFADAIVPQYIADLVSWAQIGSAKARSLLSAELASGLSMPVGFGAPEATAPGVAEAMARAARPHPFLGVSKQGVAGVVHTTGNGDCSAVVAGDANVADTSAKLDAAGLPSKVVVDCSADARPLDAVKRVAAAFGAGGTAFGGVLLKASLAAGAQPAPAQDEAPGAIARLKPGVSITEPCVGWDETAAALQALADAVKLRRTVAAADATAEAGTANGKAELAAPPKRARRT